MEFTREEFARYSRHLILPEFNIEGQRRLKQSRVLIVGAGGLGCPVLQYLAAAGVGTIGIVDSDTVDISNLQRQILYTVQDQGKPKAKIAAQKITALNPNLNVVPFQLYLNSENVLEIFDGYDLIIDGTDNFPTRYLINDACVMLKKPFIYGSIYRFEGQVAVFNLLEASGERGPNYRDLYPDPPPPELVPNCAEGGVLGVLPGIIGSLQALEAIKILSGVGESLSGKLLLLNAKNADIKIFSIPKDPNNPISGKNPTITELIDYEAFCNAFTLPEVTADIPTISPKDLKTWMDGNKDFQLIDVREPFEKEIADIGGVLIPEKEIMQHVHQIDQQRPVVFYCRTGIRSGRVVRLLREEFGLRNVYNLDGGILAYIHIHQLDIPIY